ncbi:MAG: hypothetical protein H0V82_10495 [Candidatus Protochlamydia sp.]|nr:hypothetical protein [Candidatus Protochlamydia sp.]
MICSDNTLKNSAVLNQFEEMQAHGKNPLLGVYRGKNLMIISYQANGLSKKNFTYFH